MRKLNVLILELCLFFVQPTFADVCAAPGRWVDEGSFSYYIPKNINHDAGLIVFLHGCRQGMDEAVQSTRLNEHAEREGFIVLYPEQSYFRNPLKCWNFFVESQTLRGAREMKGIVEAVQYVQDTYVLNKKKTYAMGFSAGGGMTSMLMACYPDIFAAGAVFSGPAYKSIELVSTQDNEQDELGSFGGGLGYASPYSNTELATFAYNCMKSLGTHRSLPILSMAGYEDKVVDPKNADQVVSQFVLVSDLILNGNFRGIDENEIVAPDQFEDFRDIKGKHSFSVSTYRLPDGRYSKKIMVKGMNHAWSGGPKEVYNTDEKGPDATRLGLEFFKDNAL